MKAIITGMNGTVAPLLAQTLRGAGHEVVAWDRNEVAIDDEHAMRGFLQREQPDWFFHVATGPPDWAESVARLADEMSIRFFFTSTVSVFSENGTGPYRITDSPNATDDYGSYKRECEQRIMAVNTNATIARLGWQIGSAPGSNNMIDYLARTHAERGCIEASSRWIPCCSLTRDTADALLDIAQHHPPGLYHLNGNPGLSFFEIAGRLNSIFGFRWKVYPSNSPSRDDRLLDDRIFVVSLAVRLYDNP